MKRQESQNNLRNNNGQSLLTLLFVLAVFCIGPLGFLACEFAHYNLAMQQLKGCLDSAILAGAATNASYDNPNIIIVQQTAMATALTMFKQNSVLGQSLATAVQSSSLPLEPGPNQALIYFEFVDPTTNPPTPVALGDPRGKTLRGTASFGFVPIFGEGGKTPLFAPTYPATAISSGGLPRLDVILVFDISASMDDGTLVSLVYRWKDKTGPNQYTPMAQGKLYDAVQAIQPDGTAVNAFIPQNLDDPVGPQTRYTFDHPSKWVQGSPPPLLSSGSTPPPLHFTDMIVNLDGTNNFSTPITVNGFNFPNIGTAVEAARGNLENKTFATQANIPWQKWKIDPRPGYWEAYNELAHPLLNPISFASRAAQRFFTVINNNCDAHFSLVTFSTVAGLNDKDSVPNDDGTILPGPITDLWNDYDFQIIEGNTGYHVGPFFKTPLPAYNLDLNNNNLAGILNSLGSIFAYGGTNIPDALQIAINEMKTSSRTGATKAIVLFTDGLPNMYGRPPTQDRPTSLTLSRQLAQQASEAGIPIYCIGLCQTDQLVAEQNAILTDQNLDPTTGGIAGISGHGAQFFQTRSAGDLTAIFENVARSLVQLVH